MNLQIPKVCETKNAVNASVTHSKGGGKGKTFPFGQDKQAASNGESHQANKEGIHVKTQR